MIYLDYQATTPLASEVRAAMLPWLGGPGEGGYGNPHSPYRLGREAAAAIAVARAQVAAPFGPGGRIVFTSGATEAANWAMRSVTAGDGLRGRRIVTIATEHSCVLESARAMAAGGGGDLVVLPVGPDGLVDLDRAAAAIDGRTALVAAMLVNNEIGVIQPVAELGRMARAAGALMLCDAVQGYGRVPLPVDACDMIAITAHKVHGPKGVGALWLRDGLVPPPLLIGGGQEEGLRSGTMSPLLIAGFGAAAALAYEHAATDARHVVDLRARALAAFGDEWVSNGHSTRRYAGNLNMRRDGLDVGRLMSELRDIAFSAGSACASYSRRPSRILTAIGLSDAEARSSIRIGFGRYTTADEIDEAAARINQAACRQREWA